MGDRLSHIRGAKILISVVAGRSQRMIDRNRNRCYRGDSQNNQRDHRLNLSHAGLIRTCFRGFIESLGAIAGVLIHPRSQNVRSPRQLRIELEIPSESEHQIDVLADIPFRDDAILRSASTARANRLSNARLSQGLAILGESALRYL